MRSPVPATIVIACPHCGTRYQVPPETIGKGRTVSCAHCGKEWKAEPPRLAPPKPAAPAPKPAPKPPRPAKAAIEEEKSDRLFEQTEEAELDAAFAAAAEESLKEVPAGIRNLLPKGEVPPPEVLRTIAQIKAAISSKVKLAEKVKPAPKPTPDGDLDPELAAAQGRFMRRQRQIARNLPAAKLRRTARIGAIATLVAVLALGFMLRTDIVRAVPDLAGVYGALGIKVNVIGLDFTDLETLRSKHSSGETLKVTANIVSVEAHTVPVPPVVVSLFDDHGQSLYQWSVTPRVGELEPGEVISFSAELASPPVSAARATLSFAGGARRDGTATTPPAQPVSPAQTVPPAQPEEPAHHG